MIRVLRRKIRMLHSGDAPAPPLQAERPPLINTWPPTWDPVIDRELPKVPKGLKQRDVVYGKPVFSIGANGHFKVDRQFSRNLGLVSHEEFPQYSRNIYMHKRVRCRFIEALNRAFEVCPDWRPERIGCFNPRRMRHSKNPRVPFSDHSYAIAFDIDPSKNRACSRKKYPNRPHPFQIGWDEFSDIPEGVIIAFESCGFEWGARWKTFCDPMHFSLRKIGK